MEIKNKDRKKKKESNSNQKSNKTEKSKEPPLKKGGEGAPEKQDIRRVLEVPEKNRRKFAWKWPISALLITLLSSFLFGISSEFLLSSTGMVVAIVLLLFFLTLNTVCDMLGVAVAAATEEPFLAMSSRKIRGAKEGLMLVKNAEKVSSIFCDIIGDICGILSGAIGGTVVLHILGNSDHYGLTGVLVASIVSACIAAITVFLKSVGKAFAINQSNRLIFTLGKVLNFFKFK